MPRAFIVNASPLILLARVGRLDLLTSVAGTVQIPESVVREVEAGNERDGAGTAVRQFDALQIVPDVEIPETIQLWDLGLGESQVIARVLEYEAAEAILDDRTARRCARSLGIPVLGTLGLAITCRHLGLIPAARTFLDELRVAGLRLKPAIMEVADYLNLSPRSLQAWRYRGGVPPFIAISRRAVRYRKDDLDSWVSSLVRTSTSDLGEAEW